jgi:hypothetical protein
MPRSAVCRNHEGSRDPSAAAICSRLGSGSSDVCRVLSIPALRTSGVGAFCAAGLEPGRCCHESVPERARLVALVAVFAEDPTACELWAGAGDVAALARFTAAKPLNSGTTSCVPLCSLAVSAFILVSGAVRLRAGSDSARLDERFDEGLRDGVLSSRIGRTSRRLLNAEDVGAIDIGLSGEMDRARSMVGSPKISTLD